MKAGDYVRTEDGVKKVLKYTYNEKYENGHCVWFDNKDYGILFTDEEINKMKSSPNIIDLIEVGDYVNGNKIIKINNDHYGRTVLVWGFDNGDFQCAFAIYEDEIKTIVAKEQFSQTEYKVGDNL